MVSVNVSEFVSRKRANFVYMFVFLYVCVCERERERESISVNYSLHTVVVCLHPSSMQSGSQGLICWGSCTCCHAEIEVAIAISPSQYTYTGPTSRSTYPVTTDMKRLAGYLLEGGGGGGGGGEGVSSSPGSAVHILHAPAGLHELVS